MALGSSNLVGPITELGGSAIGATGLEAASGGLGPAPNPPFSNVTLLSGFEGADMSTSFTDESEDARIISGFGNAQIDTAQFRFGSSSLLLDGTGDFLTLPDSDDWEFDQAMTVEAFVRLNE